MKCIELKEKKEERHNNMSIIPVEKAFTGTGQNGWYYEFIIKTNAN
jgi:hypothetical protein